MIKRRAMGKNDGVALIAEGLAYRLGDREEIERLLGKKVPLDAAGHIRLAEIPLARLLADELTERFAASGSQATIVPQTIGYMLRCAPPTPKDMAYCRDLGHGGVRLLLQETLDVSGGVMVTIQAGNICPMYFADMVDPKTNRTRIRTVDVHSDAYRVARAYMIRLETSDLDDPVMLAKLANVSGMSEQGFEKKFRRAATRIASLAPGGCGANVKIPTPQAASEGHPVAPASSA
jgi:6-phosphofructokinase 1